MIFMLWLIVAIIFTSGLLYDLFLEQLIISYLDYSSNINLYSESSSISILSETPLPSPSSYSIRTLTSRQSNLKNFGYNYYDIGIDSNTGDAYFLSPIDNSFVKLSRNLATITPLSFNFPSNFINFGGIYIEPTDDESNPTIYLSDTNNNLVYKYFSANSTYVVFAGTVRGFAGDNGLAIHAKLNRPNGIVKDIKDNIIYIADSMNHRIRKIDSNNIITTYAGSGSTGLHSCTSKSTYDNYLPATSSCLNTPMSLALDNEGNLYYNNLLSNKIERVDKKTQNIRLILGQETLDKSIYYDYLSNIRMNYQKDKDLKQIVEKQIENERIKKKLLKKMDSKNYDDNIIKELEVKLKNLNLKNNFYSSKEILLNYPSSVYFNTLENTLYVSDSNNYLIYKVHLNTTLYENEYLVEVIAGNLLEGYDKQNDSDIKRKKSDEGNLSLHTSLPLVASLKGDNQGILYMTDYSNKKIRLLIDNNY